MWQRVGRVIGVLMFFIVILTASVLAEERADELDRVTSDFQQAIQKSDLASWSTDIDVLIAESLGTRFGWDSVVYRLISSGELEVLCPDTARVLRLSAELGVAEAMVSTLGGHLDMDETDYYDMAVLRAWILAGMGSGLLSGDTYGLSLEVIDYALGTSERIRNTSIDESLFDEYGDFYRNVLSLEWIQLLLDGGTDAVKSRLSVFWEARQLDFQPGYDISYIDSFILPMVMNWFAQRSDVLNQEICVALEQAKLEQSELKVIITGSIQYVDYFGNRIEGPSSELVVSIVSDEKTLASSPVHQGRFVVEIHGKELAMNYPNRLAISLDRKQGSSLHFYLYEDLPVSLMLVNHASRWLSKGVVVFAHPEPVKVQLVRDLVRFEILNSDLTPRPGVVVTVQDVQLPANSEGIVEVEGMSTGAYSVIAGLASEMVNVTYGTDPLVIPIILPEEDEILSVPEEPSNHFADMTAELLGLKKALIDESITLPDFFTYYNLNIRKAKEESMWLAAAWSRYKDIRERNLRLVLRDQDEEAVEELSKELSRELARINAQWFAGQEEFLRTADEVLQKYLSKRVEMIKKLGMLEEQVSNLVEETVSLKASVSTETSRVLQGIGELQGRGIEFAASSMKRDALEEGRAYLRQLANNIEDAAVHVENSVDRLSVILDELFQCALEYERLYEAVTGEVVGPDIVSVYREGLGVLRKGEALRDSKYLEFLDIYGKEVLARIEQIISDSNRLSSITTEILSRVSELPIREELDSIKQCIADIKDKAQPIFGRMSKEKEGTQDESIEFDNAEVMDDDGIEQAQQAREVHEDIGSSESVFEPEQETMALSDILQLFALLDKVTELRQDTVSILEKDGIYENLSALLGEGEVLIMMSEYIFDDVLKEWEQATGFVSPILEGVGLLREGLWKLENDIRLAFGDRLEDREVYEALYDEGVEFAERLKREIAKLSAIADDPAIYAEDEEYEQFTREYQELRDEYISRWTGLMSLSQIDDVWREFNLAYDYCGVKEARRALEERREALANLEIIELMFNTDVDLGIDFATAKTVTLSSAESTDLTIVRWDEPRAFVPEGSGLKDLGIGTLSSHFELSRGSYSDALYLQEGHVYVVRQPDGGCAKLRVDEIVRVRRSIAGKLTSTQYTIKLSYLYPIPEQLFQ